MRLRRRGRKHDWRHTSGLTTGFYYYVAVHEYHNSILTHSRSSNRECIKREIQDCDVRGQGEELVLSGINLFHIPATGLDRYDNLCKQNLRCGNACAGIVATRAQASWQRMCRHRGSACAGIVDHVVRRHRGNACAGIMTMRVHALGQRMRGHFGDTCVGIVATRAQARWQRVRRHRDNACSCTGTTHAQAFW